MRGQPIIAGGVILILCAGFVAADYVLSEQPHIIAMQDETVSLAPEIPTMSSGSISSISSSSAMMPSSQSSIASSLPSVVKKGVSTKKASGINIDNVLTRLQLLSQPSSESSFLLLAAPDRSKVKTTILLRNNDRAFLFSWMESDDVKTVFASLKQALQEQFSGKVTDLIDETRTPETGPPVDYLSFTDPVLSAERIVFLRVRTRLYELHVAKNGEDIVNQLVAELSQ